VLPFLAWERSIDIWNPDWPDQIKRNVIASIPLHFKKGVAYAIEQYVRCRAAAGSDLATAGSLDKVAVETLVELTQERLLARSIDGRAGLRRDPG
jgi:phage tail P2-like protein